MRRAGDKPEMAIWASARGAMGELHLTELGLNVFLLGFVVDVSNINPPAACDLATMVNLAQGKGAVLR